MKPIILIALILLASALQACATATNSCQLPALNVTWWAAAPEAGEIIDVQHNKHIKATDPAFGEFACMPLNDVFQLYGLIQTCRSCVNGTAGNQSQTQHQQ